MFPLGAEAAAGLTSSGGESQGVNAFLPGMRGEMRSHAALARLAEIGTAG